MEAFGHRLVAVKSKLHFSKEWKTVPDFLSHYIKTAMGEDWGTAELKKPLEQRHPILQWYQKVCEQQRAAQTEHGKVFSTPITGAIASYLHLAYDLYTLEHNVELQKKLVARLRIEANFEGARYEVFVAAALIRAGFEIEFENEDDGSRTHCEFTATYRVTERKFSVEAKCQTGNSFKLGRQLNRALAKQADHERLVFIEINEPDDGTKPGIPALLSKGLRILRRFEGKLVAEKPLPSAYLLVTNTPWHYHLEGDKFRCSSMAEGFQIPDFKMDAEFPTLRAAIIARKKHRELFALMLSLRDHSGIPETFDGEIPEFAFGEGPPRLLIGHRYLIPDADGLEQVGTLTTATVSEAERTAYCGFALPSGKSIICTNPLTDAEMAAWKEYPDTFFGTLGQRSNKAESPLELYDFFLTAYSKTPKERLLEFLAGAPDLEDLKKLDQPTLANTYCERIAMAAFAKEEAQPPIEKPPV